MLAGRLAGWASLSRLRHAAAAPCHACAGLLARGAASTAEAASAIESPAHVVVARPEELEQVMPISHELGELRRRSLATKGVVVRYAVTEPLADAGLRRPADSWLELTYPFSSSASLREQYQRFNTPLVRLGLILEDVDGFAGDIAHRHARDAALRHVTASVDKITWLQSPPEGSVCLARDLRFTGQVAWAGTSSMEVLLEAHTRGEGEAGWAFGGLARFVMVARDTATGQAARVAALAPETKQQHNLAALGHYNREVRKRKRETSLVRAAPTRDEVAMLHSLMTSGRARSAAPMAATRRTSVRLMNRQDRNVSGIIYGGYLLREAFELAFATATLHARAFCEPLSIEDVAFLHPVQIGDIVEFTAQVAYAASPVLRVNVRASTLGEQQTLTNDFTVSFEKQRGAVEHVVPHTLADAWLHIHGHRQHQQELEEKNKSNAVRRVHGLVDREV